MLLKEKPRYSISYQLYLQIPRLGVHEDPFKF